MLVAFAEGFYLPFQGRVAFSFGNQALRKIVSKTSWASSPSSSRSLSWTGDRVRVNWDKINEDFGVTGSPVMV